ncbi:unnamed protein product [Clavelina lepadiformis]|uniref:Armadillo repeat-containing protein 6 n=1 Tax=Clavelina lepadiformis TaxID=159417 RepID=A0ABP0GT01_CLALP
MAAVKAITQETFDQVVRENIEDFEMEEMEAVNDAVEQFTSQGVSLTMIIKAAKKDGHKVIKLVEELKSISGEDLSDSDNECLKSVLNLLTTQFKNDLANRYQAAKIANAHKIVFEICQVHKENKEIFPICLATFASLIDGQPDLISTDGIDFLLTHLQVADDEEITALFLRIIRFSCTKHESNRVHLVKSNGIEHIMLSAERFKGSISVVREACGALRCLTMDDDVRVQFGKAHEHTKLVVMEHSGLERLFQLARTHEQHATVSSEVCLTMGKLMVRNEFCQQLVDLGGLDLILSITEIHIDKQNVVRQCVTLLKAISGNDDVKVAVVKAGGIDFLLKTLNNHKSNASICEACFAALTTLALRNPSHCDAIMSKNAALLMKEAMLEHSDHPGVQKQACMAVRNLVARTRHHTKAFIDHGVEGLIRRAREQHKKVLEDESKAALRDLEVDVELKERWRGENIGITS